MTATTCTGAGDCPAERHIHGCFADLDFGMCDDLVDHGLAHPSRHVRAWAKEMAALDAVDRAMRDNVATPPGGER